MLNNFANILGMDQVQSAPQYIQVGPKSFQIVRKIAEGGFGFVYQVSDSNTGQQYALKKVVLHNKETLKIIKNECTIWKEVSNHTNIVTFVDAKQQGDSIHILSELCSDGTLLDLLEKYNGKLSEAQIVHISIDICQGLNHMHEKGIQHRDIKVENILLSQKSFKLCDFGSASKSILDPQQHSS